MAFYRETSCLQVLFISNVIASIQKVMMSVPSLGGIPLEFTEFLLKNTLVQYIPYFLAQENLILNGIENCLPAEH